jgi:hypothetical protein
MRLRRVLAGAVMTLAVGTAVLAGLAAALIVAPERLVTTRVAAAAVRFFAAPYHPRWTRFEFTLRSASRSDKEVTVRAADLCFADARGVASGCLKELAARFTVSFSLHAAPTVRVARLTVRGDRLRLDLTKAATASSPRSPAGLSGSRIDALTVDLPELEVVSASATVSGGLHLDFDDADTAPAALAGRWRRVAGGVVSRGSVRASAVSDLAATGRLTWLDARGTLESGGVRARFSAHAARTGAAAGSLHLLVRAARGDAVLTADATGYLTPTAYSATGQAAVTGALGPLKSLRLSPFTAAAARRPGSFVPNELTADGRFQVDAALPASWRTEGVALPPTVGGRISVRARSMPTFLQDDRFTAELAVDFEPYRSWFTVGGGVKATVSGRVSRPGSVRVDETATLDASAPRFQDLVAFLGRTPYAVPAPFDVLTGPLALVATSRGEPRGRSHRLGVALRADLRGEKQRLKLLVRGDGDLEDPASARRTLTGSLTATVDEATIQLPHLDALKMPAVALDPRFKDSASHPAPRRAAPAAGWSSVTSSAVAVGLRLVTQAPVLFLTDLAQSPVPVALDLRAARPGDRPVGTVGVRSFHIKFFRREAVVDHLTLTFSPGSTATDLDGLIRYDAAEAAISIRLLGTVEKPRIELESVPPMSNDDLVALLLFGKSPNELDSDQASTVANTQTAISDKAFGLASLYLFASTPIQFVGYDPATKAYVMRFKIPGGETLELGSAADTTKSIQLRKRLSDHFAIQAQGRTSQEQGNGLITFLEWFARY